MPEVTAAERRQQLHDKQASLFRLRSRYEDEARRIAEEQERVFDEWMSLMGVRPDTIVHTIKGTEALAHVERMAARDLIDERDRVRLKDVTALARVVMELWHCSEADNKEKT